MIEPTWTQWTTYMKQQLLDDYDQVIALTGPVGRGKNDKAYKLAADMNPHFRMDRDMVVRDDLPMFQRQIMMRIPFKVILVEEAIWFFYKQWHAYAEVRVLTPEFISNRKEGRIWILLLPSKDKMLEELRDERVKWELRSKDRTIAELYENVDELGTFRYRATWTDIPPVPQIIHNEERRLLDMHAPNGGYVPGSPYRLCNAQDGCVTALRGGRRYDRAPRPSRGPAEADDDD